MLVSHDTVPPRLRSQTDDTEICPDTTCERDWRGDVTSSTPLLYWDQSVRELVIIFRRKTCWLLSAKAGECQSRQSELPNLSLCLSFNWLVFPVNKYLRELDRRRSKCDGYKMSRYIYVSAELSRDLDIYREVAELTLTHWWIQINWLVVPQDCIYLY